jgi:Do/DeqQ family serine protease
MAYKKQKRNFYIISLVAIMGTITLGLYLLSNSIKTQSISKQSAINQPSPIQLTQLTVPATATETPSFVSAAQKATPAVVHITAKYEAKIMRRGTSPIEELFKDFLGEGFELGPKEYKTQPGTAFGSGVIISEDGYIVTNNHVIDKADQIEVTLDDNRRYTAKVVGTDPDTDLALLKIEEKKLSFLLFGDSNKLQVGEWVLAVGNPFNLTSTVTKGIVSAKARRADIARSGGGIKIEAFIQTDAAVNKGNSGGALVNLQGELVGINTAISTPTGAFAGYSFAIPSSIVQRIISDLKKYGTVQRAILGIFPLDVNADLVEEKKLKRFDGVYVNGFSERSAAAEAGLKEGDIIVAINNTKIKNLAQLHEQLTHYQPGDKVSVLLDRKGKEITIPVTLKNALNEIKIVHGQDSIEVEGATFGPLDQAIKQKLGLKAGVQIKVIKPGKWQQAGIKKGFIVVAIDKEPTETLDQLATILNSKKGGILIEGIYPNGTKAYYGIGWGDL